MTRRITSIHATPLPANALLAAHAARGAFTDCYSTEIARSVSLESYVERFYTGGLFKIERRILALVLSAPSTDAEARELAAGTRDTFSAWRVEARTADQLLMSDVQGRTRSWLMVAPAEQPGGTRLYFGSAVLPIVDRATGRARMSLGFSLLLGFHRVYSHALLRAAASRLMR